jgi:hypothetical protein
MNLGVDLHDTLSYAPGPLLEIIRAWRYDVYIVTGTPPSKREETVTKMTALGLQRTDYRLLLMGYEYDKCQMGLAHFKRMREHKLQLLADHEIAVYIDDNPFYAEHMRNHGITVLQLILSDEYIDRFGQQDPFFSCHLQRKQFAFLSTISDAEVKK